jgi:hypothetical protein
MPIMRSDPAHFLDPPGRHKNMLVSLKMEKTPDARKAHFPSEHDLSIHATSATGKHVGKLLWTIISLRSASI